MSFFNSQLGRCATLLALGGGVALYSQGTQTASATVTVVDSAGAPVADARVIMRSPSLMGDRQGVTNAQGAFLARLLPPGTYSIEVIREGFQTTRLNNRTIGMDQHYQPKITLQPVGGEIVVVQQTASAAVDPTDVKTASNFDAGRIDTLPMGRAVANIAQTSPGVTTGVNNIQIRGSNGTGNLYLVDGQNLHDNVYNSLAFPIVNDAIEEVQVITGAISAEYGNVEGGVINTITKSGGNTFTGQARVNLSNPAWNAVKPGQNRRAIANLLSEDYTYTIGGYLWKDRLWFHASYYNTHASTSNNIASDAVVGPGGANTGWNRTVGRQTRTLKLTYQVNEDHSIIGTYSNGSVTVDRIDYLSGELNTLVPQTENYEMYNIAWRALWNPNFNTEVRFGGKTMMISGGAKGVDKDAIYNFDDGYFYNAGLFNGDDGGDNRDNNTANLKGSLFFTAAGTHTLDFGADYYKGSRQAQNQQSPTNRIFFVEEWSIENQTGLPVGVWDYISTDASANLVTWGIYVNDRWKVNDNLAFNIGLRWDTYKADADDFQGTVASASGFSPRLGVIYDLFGDQKWIFKASYCRYNGSVLEAITGAVSGAGNPTEIEWVMPWAVGDGPYPWLDGSGDPIPQPLSVITNMANYPYITSYINPTLNMAINKNMKAPSVDEFQLTAAYSLITDGWGQGYVSLTGVKKKWNNLIDYSIGNNGSVYEPIFDEYYYIRRWDNVKEAERKYEALELVADYTFRNLHFNGNVTWSTLEGNYDGEVQYEPGAAQGINFFSVVDGVRMYNTADRTPYGYLTGHRPLKINASADYTMDSWLGRTVFGLIYRFQSGEHFSHTRVNRPGALNPALPSDFGSTWTQFMNGRRGEGVFNASAYHDLAVTHEFNIFKVYGTQVKLFLKAIAYNVFNHAQLLSWNIQYGAVPVAGASLDSPWVTSAAYGTSGTTNYGDMRSYSLSAGLRF